MRKPLAIDLFCGLGGFTEGLLAEGYDCVGFDIERHEYGDDRYPAQLVLQDVLTLHGRQFKDASLIVASPPCQAYSYRAMPWKKAKALPPPCNKLFEACFRIQREASEAAGHHIPMVVENVRGAQKWVGRSRGKYGSFHFWGDVPALMPIPLKRGVKVGGLGWNGFKRGDPNYKGQAFNTTTTTRERKRAPFPHDAGISNKVCGWFGANNPSAMRQHSSKSSARKRATALISKIPLELSRHIARVYYPSEAKESP